MPNDTKLFGYMNLPEPAATQEWARNATKGKGRRVKDPAVESELHGERKKDARMMRKLDLNENDVRGFKTWRQEQKEKGKGTKTFRQYDKAYRNYPYEDRDDAFHKR